MNPLPFYGKMTKHKGVVGTYCVVRSTYWNYPGLILNGETYLQIQVGLIFFVQMPCRCPAFSANEKPQKKEKKDEYY